jgi:hypothetical protein
VLPAQTGRIVFIPSGAAERADFHLRWTNCAQRWPRRFQEGDTHAEQLHTRRFITGKISGVRGLQSIKAIIF